MVILPPHSREHIRGRTPSRPSEIRLVARWRIAVGLGALLVLLALAEAGGAPLRRPLLVVQGGHREMAHAVALSPDGRTLASAGADDTAVLWDIPSGNLLAALEHGSYVYALAFSPDGRTLATGGADDLVRLWSVETGRLLATLEGHQKDVVSLSFRPDGRQLASGDEGGSGRLWDVASRRSVATLPQAARVAFSPDGRTLATGFEEIRLWRDGRSTLVGTVEHSLQDLAWSPDGRTLATATWDGTVRLWDVPSRKLTHRLEGHQDPDGNLGKVALAFSPDGRTLAAGADDGTIHLWDPRTGRRRHLLARGQGDVEGLVFRGDGRGLFSSGLGHPVVLWDARTGRKVREFRSPVREPLALAFAPGSLRVATREGTRAWSRENGVPGPTTGPDGLSSMAMSADGSVVLTGHVDGSVRIGDRDLGSPAAMPVMAAALSPDGRVGATASNDGTARIWELPDGRLRHVLTTQPGRVALNAVAFSPDGRTLATGGDDSVVRFWDVETGAEGEPWILRPDGASTGVGTMDDGVESLVWTRDGLIAGMSRGLLLTRTGSLPEPHTGLVSSLAVHGNLLATTSADRTATIREMPSGRVLRRLQGHTWRVRAAAFHPDGHVLVTAGEDGTLRVWSVATGRPLAVAMAMDGDEWLVTSPEGFVDGSLPGMQRVLWRMSDRLRDTLLPEQFLADFYHPGLLAEVLSRGLPVPDLLRERGDPRASMEIARKDRRLPRVTVSAAKTAATRTMKVRVHLAPAPSGVRDVRLFRDGTLTKLWPGRRAERVLEATVPVKAGPNVFQAYAFNGDNVKSQDSPALSVTGSPTLARPGRTLAVLIGIDRYEAPGLPLAYAAADARLLDETLRRRGPGEVVTRVVLDGEATREGILQALGWLVRTAQPEDLAVVSYSGHGLRFGGRFYLLPQDFQPEVASRDAASFEAATLGDLRLQEALLPLQAGNSVLILDACHSGAALEGEDWRLGPVNGRGLGQLAWEKGMDVLAASQSQESAMEAREIGGQPLGHGLLTWALARDAFARPDPPHTIGGWLDSAARRVPRLLEESSSPATQRPRVFHGGKGTGRELRP